jgi:hypothetical protein
MATLNTIRNVVSNYGANAGTAPVITLTTSVGATVTLTAGAEKLSVGDVIEFTSPGGGFVIGDRATVISIDYTAGTADLDVLGTGVSAGETAKIVNFDGDKIASVGGSTSSSNTANPVSITWGDGTVSIANGGSITLASLDSLYDFTDVEVLLIVDKVYNAAGNELPEAILTFQVTDGTTTALVANLSQGDVFYTSSFSANYYDGAAAATATDLTVFNPQGVAVRPVIRLVLGSKN